MPSIKAPWPDDFIKRLRRWNSCGYAHEYTCGEEGCRAPLRPTTDGWVCDEEGCGYTQDWAHEPPTLEEFDQMDARWGAGGSPKDDA